MPDRAIAVDGWSTGKYCLFGRAYSRLCRRETTIRRNLVGWGRRCTDLMPIPFHHERNVAFRTTS